VELAEAYNIGRPTVRQAIELLVSKGMADAAHPSTGIEL